MANSHLTPQLQSSGVKTTPGGFPGLVLLSFTPVSPSDSPATFLGFVQARVEVFWICGSGQPLTHHISEPCSALFPQTEGTMAMLPGFILDSNTFVMITVGNNCSCPQKKKFWPIPGILNNAVKSYILRSFRHFQENWAGVGADT